ncbi:MAG: hypothetical protein WKF77_20315 [Planctomycetaceae bacterium]
MSDLAKTCPQTREQVINMYFLEHRAKLLDVAAFLDRIDRAQPGTASSDFREAALKGAIGVLIDGQSQRAKRVLELFSDATAEMPQSAHGMKGASGAVKTATGGGK